MKIAMLTPGGFRIPHTEEFIYAPGIIVNQISNGLVDLGHKVTLFAPKGSRTKGSLYSGNLDAIFSDKFLDVFEKPKILSELLTQNELFLASSVFEQVNQNEFEIIHAHDYRKVIYFAKLVKAPMVFTYHGNMEADAKYEVEKERMKKYKNDIYSVAISKYQYNANKKFIRFVDVVHHGLDVKKYPFIKQSNDKLLFFGRYIKSKDPIFATKVAKELKKNIDLAGRPGMGDQDISYYNELKKSFSAKFVTDKGYIHFDKIPSFIKDYKVMLMPISRPEPFGLTMIESMACGVPVVAYNTGSVDELIIDGITGFKIKPGDTKGFIKAVNTIYSLSEPKYLEMRNNCRKHIEKNFTIEKMVKGYEAVYKKVINDYKKSFKNKD